MTGVRKGTGGSLFVTRGVVKGTTVFADNRLASGCNSKKGRKKRKSRLLEGKVYALGTHGERSW